MVVGLTREHGVATVLVTHDPAHLVGVDRVVAMRDGAVGQPTDGDRVGSISRTRS